MLSSFGLLVLWWRVALLACYFILNRVPFKESNKTPYKNWKGKIPNINFVRVWGCLTEVNVSRIKKKRLVPNTIDAMFIGYARYCSVYRFFIIKLEVQGIEPNTIMESRDAKFFEVLFPFKNKVERSLPVVNFPSTSNQHTILSNPESLFWLENKLERGKWVRKEKDFGLGFYIYYVEEDLWLSRMLWFLLILLLRKKR